MAAKDIRFSEDARNRVLRGVEFIGRCGNRHFGT